MEIKNSSQKDTILIIDDRLENLELLFEILKKDYRCILSQNMQDTFDILNNDKISLILLDIMIPVTDGFTIIKKIKDDTDFYDIPVIFISARNDISAKVQAFQLGAVDYISKPFEEMEVIARVKTHIELQNKINIEIQLKKELQKKIDEINELKGILPICSKCKKIRNDKGYWEQVETYISNKSNLSFTHGLCDECANETVNEINNIKRNDH